MRGPFFLENLVGDRHLANVVKKGAASDDIHLFLGHAHRTRNRDRESSDTLGVVLGLGVLEIERIPQRFERDVIGSFQVGKGTAELLRTLCDERLEVRLVGPIFHFEAPVLERPPDSGKELLALEGLQQVIISTVADSGQRDGDVVHGGNHHDRHIGVTLLGALQQADTVEIGHH